MYTSSTKNQLVHCIIVFIVIRTIPVNVVINEPSLQGFKQRVDILEVALNSRGLFSNAKKITNLDGLLLQRVRTID